MILQALFQVGRPSMIARMVSKRAPDPLRPNLFITLAKSNYFTYNWAVENVNKFYSRPVYSPFFIMPSENSKWCIELCHQDMVDPGVMSFKLLKESGSRFLEMNDMDYELSILAIDGSCLIKKKYFSSGAKVQHGLYLPRDEVLRQKKSLFLPNNTLTVQCKMNSSKVVHCFARSRLRMEKVSLPFRIEDFCSSDVSSRYTEEVQPAFFRNLSIYTQLFCSSSGDEKLQVKLQAGLKSPRNAKYTMDCYTCKISLIDALGKEECIVDETRFNFNRCRHDDAPQEAIALPLTRNMLMEKSRKYLPNGALSLNCIFTFYLDDLMKEIVFTKYGNSDHHEINSMIFNENKEEGVSTIEDDLRSLYGDKILCDFTIQTETKLFPVHKSILISRSPCFRSMILNCANQDLCISNVDSETMHRFVMYLYTDKVEDTQWEDALKLYAAAKKFRIPSLMKKCSLILMEKLTTRNVCDILHFAYKHGDEDMKSSIRDFILEHDVVIFTSDKWIKMEETNKLIAAETLRLVCLKKRK